MLARLVVDVGLDLRLAEVGVTQRQPLPHGYLQYIEYKVAETGSWHDFFAGSVPLTTCRRWIKETRFHLRAKAADQLGFLTILLITQTPCFAAMQFAR
ncbi:MAG: hypothetical protein FJW26_16920 [Acidimicrobiia bacterium]|nr:hypothetical protein [Acidimicrobiia bacterium]